MKISATAAARSIWPEIDGVDEARPPGTGADRCGRQRRRREQPQFLAENGWGGERRPAERRHQEMTARASPIANRDRRCFTGYSGDSVGIPSEILAYPG